MDKKPTILAIVGSLRKGSFNRRLAEITKAALGDRATFTILDFSDVPMFNEDHEFPPPDAVRRVREAIDAADGLWFFTAEYNHTYSGVLKNLVDWLSRPISKTVPSVLGGKPAAISGITPSIAGTIPAQDHLVMLLSYLNVRVMNVPRVSIPGVFGLMDENGNIALGEAQGFVNEQADAYLAFIDPA